MKTYKASIVRLRHATEGVSHTLLDVEISVGDGLCRVGNTFFPLTSLDSFDEVIPEPKKPPSTEKAESRTRKKATKSKPAEPKAPVRASKSVRRKQK